MVDWPDWAEHHNYSLPFIPVLCEATWPSPPHVFHLPSPVPDCRNGKITLGLSWEEFGISTDHSAVVSLIAQFTDGSMGALEVLHTLDQEIELDLATGETAVVEQSVSIDDMRLVTEYHPMRGFITDNDEPLPDTATELAAVGVLYSGPDFYNPATILYLLLDAAGGGISEFWTGFKGCKELAS